MRTLLALAVLGLPLAAQAQTLELSHQGRVMDASGEPLQGQLDITVALYNDADTGTDIWSKAYPNTNVSGGYYAVMLGIDDDNTAIEDALFARTGDVWVEVIAGGVRQTPRTLLASVPDALVARSVDTPGTSVTPDGNLVLRTVTTTTCNTTGEIAYHSGLMSVLVCDGAEFVSVSRKTIALIDGARRWSDLSYATSCNAYRTSVGGSYAGDTGSGVYRIDPDGNGPIDVYCDMDTDGGGWTLVMNLSSGAGGRKDYNVSTFWTGVGVDGTVTAAMTNDFKSRAFDRVAAGDDLMVYVHNQGSTEYGYAIYPLLAAHQGKTMHTLMNSGNDFVPVSDASERVLTQSVGTTLNTNRSQSLHGDIFIEHAGALSLNDTSGWDAARNYTRIGTTLTNDDYAHTFAGLGIDHVQASWGLVVESAPISAYCALNNGYGASNQAGGNGSTSYPYDSGCVTDDGSSFSWLPVDHAIFVR